MHLLCDALPVPFVPVQIACGALVAHWYSYTPPRSGTSQYHRTFRLTQCLCGTILVAVCSLVWDWHFFSSGSMLLCWPELLSPFLSFTEFSCSSFHLWMGEAPIHCRKVFIINLCCTVEHYCLILLSFLHLKFGQAINCIICN